MSTLGLKVFKLLHFYCIEILWKICFFNVFGPITYWLITRNLLTQNIENFVFSSVPWVQVYQKSLKSKGVRSKLMYLLVNFTWIDSTVFLTLYSFILLPLTSSTGLNIFICETYAAKRKTNSVKKGVSYKLLFYLLNYGVSHSKKVLW